LTLKNPEEFRRAPKLALGKNCWKFRVDSTNFDSFVSTFSISEPAAGGFQDFSRKSPIKSLFLAGRIINLINFDENSSIYKIPFPEM
jgi:hypothetical protein